MSLAALVAVTVAVKVTDCPELEGSGEEVRTVVVVSVYWPVPLKVKVKAVPAQFSVFEEGLFWMTLKL